jgi:hypothetical protein
MLLRNSGKLQCGFNCYFVLLPDCAGGSARRDNRTLSLDRVQHKESYVDFEVRGYVRCAVGDQTLKSRRTLG